MEGQQSCKSCKNFYNCDLAVEREFYTCVNFEKDVDEVSNETN